MDKQAIARTSLLKASRDGKARRQEFATRSALGHIYRHFLHQEPIINLLYRERELALRRHLRFGSAATWTARKETPILVRELNEESKLGRRHLFLS